MDHVTPEQIEQEVFALEGVRIRVHATHRPESLRSYRALFSKQLPDHATLADLDARVSQAAASTVFGIINPLGASQRVAPSCVLENVRKWWLPPARPTWQERVAKALRELLTLGWFAR